MGQIEHSVQRLLSDENLTDNYGIELGALSKTRFAEVWYIKEDDAGYIFV